MIQFNTRKDFLDSRNGKIGASDASIIMKESPYSTPYQLWKMKLGLDPQKPMLPHMQEGLDIEDAARDYFYRITHIKVLPFQIKHQTIPYLISSLDGIDSRGKNIVEIKRPSNEDHEYVKKYKKPPKKYFPQIQHQLECANLNSAFYLSFYKNDPILIEVERDDSYIKSMLGKEAEFYKCMTELMPPELIDRDYIEKNDDEWNKHSTCYKFYKNIINSLEKKLENTKNRLIELSNGQNCKGNDIILTKTIRKGNIDYKSIPELKNVDLEIYRKRHAEYYKIM
jgi:putative phage-type endonuclease